MNLFMTGGTKPHRQKPQTSNPPPWVANLPHLRGQRQVDKRAVYGRRKYPQAHIHSDGVFTDFYERVAQSKDTRAGRDVKGERCDLLLFNDYVRV